MTIEIHRPELQTLIEERMASGVFASVEDVLLEALLAGGSAKTGPTKTGPRLTGQALIDAMQQCPYPEFDFEVPRYPQPVRDVEI